MKKTLIIPIVLLLTTIAFSQSTTNKKPITQADYPAWKIISSTQISNDGHWVSYEVNPQKGDGMLFIYNTETNRYDSIPRAFDATFSGDSKFLACKIKPEEDTVIKAKLAKKKKDDSPKDSLGIYVMEKNHLTKVARVKSFKLAEEGSSWLAYHLEKALPVKDTTDKLDTTAKKKEKPKKKKKKKTGDGTELVIKKVIEDKSFSFKDVTDYNVSKNGETFSFIRQVKDSIDSTFVYNFITKEQIDQLIFEQEGTAKKPGLDNEGEQVAFVFSTDTAKEKNFDLFYWQHKTKEAKVIVDSLTNGLAGNWRVSEHRGPSFSENGERLFFGTAPAVEVKPKDTLPDDEKAHVDIWNWKDPLIQPQQLKQLEKEQKRNYLAVFYPDEGNMLQLADETMPDVKTYNKGNTDVALGSSDLPYQQLLSWDDGYRDYFAVDLNTGERKQLLEKQQSAAQFSPGGKYIIWWAVQDSSWYVKGVETESVVSLTKDLPYNFYSELNDMPQLPGSYGLAGWTENDGHVLIYDKYDIWKFDPTGKDDPERITAGFGRDNEIRFRYMKLDREQEYIEGEMYLSGFNYTTKGDGYYLSSPKSNEAPDKLFAGAYNFSGLIKAKEADKVIWQKSSFELYPDLWWSNMKFQAPYQITYLDKQRDQFLWGNVQLVSWTSSDGELLDGLLYTPENQDKSKKYPMLVYFYERNSDNLHTFRNPSPSRSIINPSYCVSNEYIVFVPDIPYLEGYPGQSAYRAIVSGTLAMCDQFPFIDKEKMGIQGQSWGGYQVAYLVTQTNLYKAAMAGAPVSNMTSAYGGIRWGSGMSRMFQYEKTQSRIGGTLWEKPIQYIENSPVFYVPKIETPLLIMHNDDDGAVPWYQGIEMFVAMRRLAKPAWMLTYNKEEHNLTKWPNRMDLDIRMYQFFDHYLKGAPEPQWMKEGVPAIEKGKNLGYGLE
jgi:dipeptidyl aminopeptidase/acylaminoacyl peptidase